MDSQGKVEFNKFTVSSKGANCNTCIHIQLMEAKKILFTFETLRHLVAAIYR